MSGKNRYITDPSVINVYGLLMAELSALKAQFGLSELSIVIRDGKYFLVADGHYIEITFVNGKIIPMDVWDNLQPRLGQLLEQNGYPTVAQLGEDANEDALGTFIFANMLGYILTHSEADTDGIIDLKNEPILGGVRNAQIYSKDENGNLISLNTYTDQNGRYSLSPEQISSLEQTNMVLVARGGVDIVTGKPQSYDFVARPGEAITRFSTEMLGLNLTIDEYLSAYIYPITDTFFLDRNLIPWSDIFSGNGYVQSEIYDTLNEFFEISYNLFEDALLEAKLLNSEIDGNAFFNSLMLNQPSIEMFMGDNYSEFEGALARIRENFLMDFLDFSNSAKYDLQEFITDDPNLIKNFQELANNDMEDGAKILGIDFNEDGFYLNLNEAVPPSYIGKEVIGAGVNKSGDNIGQIYLDVSDLSPGFEIELYINGELAARSDPISENDILKKEYLFKSSSGQTQFSFDDVSGTDGIPEIPYDNFAVISINTLLNNTSNNIYHENEDFTIYKW